ncbi:hypothetical protein HanIR_Chr05g0208661 [Helianthus annuus]|nr:hypothetical protein HanIR_Chr05g0208661 [Helianthus annuus]
MKAKGSLATVAPTVKTTLSGLNFALPPLTCFMKPAIVKNNQVSKFRPSGSLLSTYENLGLYIYVKRLYFLKDIIP